MTNQREEIISKLAELKGKLKGRVNDEEAGEIALRRLAKKMNIDID